jgi:hypothetical protein
VGFFQINGLFKNYLILLIKKLVKLYIKKKRYLKRESEPKDAPLWSGKRPSLQQSTYKILGKSLADDVITIE